MVRLERFGRRVNGTAPWIRAWVLLIVIAVAGGCASRKEPAEPTAEQNYQMGMERFDKKNYRDAIPYFQRILENYPFCLLIFSFPFCLRQVLQCIVGGRGYEKINFGLLYGFIMS